MKKQVLTYNLEIPDKSSFSPSANFKQLVDVRKINHDQYLSFVLFLGVGLPYSWGERLLWDNNDWNKYINNPNIHFYIGFANNSLVGYFEMCQHNSAEVEIKYFGLLPEFIGKGYGGAFLSHAIKQAYILGAQKVWLHTCEFDSEIAVKNYVSRGFKIVKEYYSEEYVPTEAESLKLIEQYFKKYLISYK